MYFVVGLGISGLATVEYLYKQGLAFVAFDTRPFTQEQKNKLQIRYSGIKFFFEDFPEDFIKQNLTQIKEVILSPGLSNQLSFLQSFKQAGIPIIGDIELFYRFNNSLEEPKKIIAITGSNGKTTSCYILHKILESLYENTDKKVFVGGNFGTPILELITNEIDFCTAVDIIVLELSSFQLETSFSLKNHVAIITNVTEDHLDRYDSFAAYRDIKLNIIKHAKMVIYNWDDEFLKERLSNLGWGVSFNNPAANFYQADGFLQQHTDNLIKKNLIALETFINKQEAFILNSLFVLAVVLFLKQEYTDFARIFNLLKIKKYLENFKGLENRCELVPSKYKNLIWVNDTKATNEGASLIAINNFKSTSKKLILLAGGEGKGSLFAKLSVKIKEDVDYVCLFGRDAKIIAASLEAISYDKYKVFDTLEEVFNAGLQDLLSAHEEFIVLLSPAAASLDQFASYIKRGECFKNLVANFLLGCE